MKIASLAVMLIALLIGFVAVLVSLAAPIILVIVILKLIDKSAKEEKLRKYSGRYPYGDEKEESNDESGE